MYNNYYNQQQYPYINNGYNNQQPNNYNQMNQQQSQQQQMQVNMNYIPLYFVSSEDDVKKYIVMPNQMAYFKDINSNTLYEKKADNFSNYTTKKYELKDLSAPSPKYATIEDIQALRLEFNKVLGVNNNEQQ